MSDIDINRMDFKQLRNEVQLLRDELALFKRKYGDVIYNLDSDNFGKSFTLEQKNMKAQVKMTAEGLKSTVAKMDKFSTIEQTAAMIRSTVNEEYVTSLIGDDVVTDAVLQSQITQTSETILLSVSANYETKSDAKTKYSSVDDDVSTLRGQISVNTGEISAIVSGSYTKNMLDGYLTGIEIAPGSIKMIDSDKYSLYDKSGLHFYNSRGTQGWAIEPHATYGGELKYYFDGSERFVFGQGMTRANPAGGNFYGTNDIVVRASDDASRFVVDLTDSDYREIKFVGLSYVSGKTNSPYIYVNEQLLATQDWVADQGYGSGGGSGTVVAVFG